MENRRKHFRHSFDPNERPEVSVSPDPNIRVELRSSRWNEPLFGNILDLSLGGMLIRLEDPAGQLSVGDPLVVSFVLPGDEQPMKFDSEVVRTQAVEDSPAFGIQFHKDPTDDSQEKSLWQFLSDAQRRQSQLLFEQLREERVQNMRIAHLLKELLRSHAAVSRAESGSLLTILVAILFGAVTAGIVAVTMYLWNVEERNRLFMEHMPVKFRQGQSPDQPPDFDKLADKNLGVSKPDRELLEEELNERQKNRAAEKQRLQEDYEQHKKTFEDEYAKNRTSDAMMILSAGGGGIGVLAVLLLLLREIRPILRERARRNLKSRIRMLIETFPQEVNSWGGAVILEDSAKVAEVLYSLEARTAEPAG